MFTELYVINPQKSVENPLDDDKNYYYLQLSKSANSTKEMQACMWPYFKHMQLARAQHVTLLK